MSSARSHYTSVSEQLCSHCRAQLGAGRGRCWWCLQAYGDQVRSQTVDQFLKRGENAIAFLPGWLASFQASCGSLFVLR